MSHWTVATSLYGSFTDKSVNRVADTTFAFFLVLLVFVAAVSSAFCVLYAFVVLVQMISIVAEAAGFVDVVANDFTAYAVAVSTLVLVFLVFQTLWLALAVGFQQAIVGSVAVVAFRTVTAW